MNYFAQGIQQGGEAGARGYLEKKKRDQDATLNKARLEFEANQLRENFKGQGDLQDKRLLADADNARLGREFTGGQNALNRSYGTSEREAGQNWQGGQNAENRAVTTGEGEKNRSLSEREASARLLLDAKRIQQGGDQFDTKLAWDKDPENPDNKYKLAHTDYLMRDNQPPALPNASTALQNGRKAMPTGELPMLTPEQAAMAKPGTRYKTTDGRTLTR